MRHKYVLKDYFSLVKRYRNGKLLPMQLFLHPTSACETASKGTGATRAWECLFNVTEEVTFKYCRCRIT